MITKTEVMEAIARCERICVSGPLDRTLTHVEKGDLAVIVEAAKAARYKNIAKPFDHPAFVLDDNSPVIAGR